MPTYFPNPGRETVAFLASRIRNDLAPLTMSPPSDPASLEFETHGHVYRVTVEHIGPVDPQQPKRSTADNTRGNER
jgi:hypothetical protein